MIVHFIGFEFYHDNLTTSDKIYEDDDDDDVRVTGCIGSVVSECIAGAEESRTSGQGCESAQ